MTTDLDFTLNEWLKNIFNYINSVTPNVCYSTHCILWGKGSWVAFQEKWNTYLILQSCQKESNMHTKAEIRVQKRRDTGSLLLACRKIWKGKFWVRHDQKGKGRP